jgi:Ras-related protein Rab-8A
MYSVSSEESFVAVEKFIEEIQGNAKGMSFVIVGTKTDLPERCVSHTRGEELAKKYNAPFFEVNNITGANVREVILELRRKIDEDREIMNSKEGV